jgi:hypothetical protein
MDCSQLDALRDYVFEELDASGRAAVERHLPQCGDCRAELDRLRLTTAALRVLPDVEIPQRIAFVSDKVFEPSPWSRWFSGARLGFASAVVMAAALVAVAFRPQAAAPVTTVASASPSADSITRQIDDAVKRAVDQVRAEDMQLTRAALEASDRKHAQEHKALLSAVEENLTVLEKRYNTLTSLTAAEFGGAQ